MSIVVRQVGCLHEAAVRPPHGRGQPWDSSHPMAVDELPQLRSTSSFSPACLHIAGSAYPRRKRLPEVQSRRTSQGP